MIRLGAALLLVGLPGCKFVSGFIGCRAHGDWKSCAGDDRCLPAYKCEADPSKGGQRCLEHCKPATTGGKCTLDQRTGPGDGCMVDYDVGRFRGCIATDHDPTRCEQGRDARGHPFCIDKHGPCDACFIGFDTCDARPGCNGMICF